MLAFLSHALYLLLHFDVQLAAMIQRFGPWTYVLLFLIIFCETGLVITPFFPGDSLIFAAGAFAARDDLNVWLLFLVFAAAAILGDTANYWIGHAIGPKLFDGWCGRFLKKEHCERTQRFYDRYGAKTIVLARFVPIVRTFAPFLAGVGDMEYRRFIAFNVLGGLGWVALALFGGYLFGNIPFVQKNFTLVFLVIVAISFLPIVIEWWNQRADKSKTS